MIKWHFKRHLCVDVSMNILSYPNNLALPKYQIFHLKRNENEFSLCLAWNKGMQTILQCASQVALSKIPLVKMWNHEKCMYLCKCKQYITVTHHQDSQHMTSQDFTTSHYMMLMFVAWLWDLLHYMESVVMNWECDWFLSAFTDPHIQ